MRFRAEMLHMRMLIKPNKACLLTHGEIILKSILIRACGSSVILIDSHTRYIISHGGIGVFVPAFTSLWLGIV